MEFISSLIDLEASSFPQHVLSFLAKQKVTMNCFITLYICLINASTTEFNSSAVI